MKYCLKFYLENKKKATSIILVMAMTVFVIYFVVSVVQSSFSNVEYSNMACLYDFSFVSPSGDSDHLENKTVRKIKKNINVEQIYSIYLETTSINNIFGTTSGYVAFMEHDDISSIFNRLNLKVMSGRMPKDGKYEIIMHENMLKNKNLSVGDEFGASVDNDEYVSGKYKIVGSFSGTSYMAFGTKNKHIEDLKKLGVNTKNYTFALIVFPSRSIDPMNQFLDNLNDKSLSSMTLSYGRKRMKDIFSSIKILMFAMVVAISISISVAVCVILHSVFNDRMPEYAILYAIGYEKKTILKNTLMEIIIMVLISWGLGIIFAFGILKTIKKIIFEPFGSPIDIISGECIVYTLVALFVFSLLSIISTTRTLYKKDLISIIEMR